MGIKITYGKVFWNAELTDYCGYIDEQGRKVDIFSSPQSPLEVYVNGRRAKAQPEHLMVWARVAGLLGKMPGADRKH